MIELGEKITTKVANDDRMSTDGGDYHTWETPLFVNGREVGRLYETSMRYSYCAISGMYTTTTVMEVANTFNIEISLSILDQERIESHRIDEKKFIELVQKYQG